MDGRLVKKIIIALFCLFIFIFICLFFYNNFSPSGPSGAWLIRQHNTKWICNDPNIYFEFGNKYGDIIGNTEYGQININNKIIEMTIDFLPGTKARCRAISSFHVNYVDVYDWLFMGDCKFSSRKLIITVTDIKSDDLRPYLEGKKLVFIKDSTYSPD